ncbi:Methylenetetrahydrofolate reductase 1 [Rhodotorula toruloides]|uniref:BY PROTMAP: gi/647401616/emb/CDR47978.1/ RHTO0S15e04522g1_1 [Rhodosporidium toruloides] n=1 Tax=Rhodotorula toruloides TaxID=5286 RepID=A0A0K3CLL9_RHOTO|nr:Methylenetetrahydrofolate reductase 1 [Rhodotorula toruloides]PRQ73916.1 Methylenetetrahydrofolate reductase-domain containing protein [Rhodotorula toruloides]
MTTTPELRSSHPSTKVVDRIAQLDPSKPFYTFEIFPPKTDAGLVNLLDRIDRMSALNPAWMHVTWGAGGSTQERSLQLAGESQSMGLETCLHLTCTNLEEGVLDRTLERAKELGVVNLLALRGDPPRGEEYWTASSDKFQHATDLIKYIRKEYGDDFCIGVAGYPEGHADSADKLADVEYLFEKQQAGADFVVTQLFYDVGVFMEWYRACRKRGITIPIIPGIMPIQNYLSFRRMTNLCGTHIPPQILDDLQRIQHDDAAVKEYGVQLAVKMMRELFENDIRGFHLCTLNLEKSVTRVLELLQWVEPGSTKISARLRKGLSPNGAPLPKVINSLRPAPSTGANVAGPDIARKDSPASWDEFPNGRFGDARSPAYGEMDGYGVSLKLPPGEAMRQWGQPTALSDVSRVFSSYLRGSLPSNPWSEEPLRAETEMISSHLIEMNDKRHWWTVGSQPAVDGAPSADSVHGFGPKGGYVYQKAFVEFFLTKEELDELERKSDEDERRRRESGEGDDGLIKWFAGNAKGDFRCNMGKGDVNAVTWGVFGAKEIVTTTLIEEMSFRAWCEEAFALWNEWSLLYPANSPSRTFIRSLADSRWLVSVVHHDYKEKDALWKWLLALKRPEEAQGAANGEAEGR